MINKYKVKVEESFSKGFKTNNLPLIGILKGLFRIFLMIASCGDRLELGDPRGREKPVTSFVFILASNKF